MSTNNWKRGDVAWLKYSGGTIVTVRVQRITGDAAIVRIGDRSTRVPQRFLRPLATRPSVS